MNATDTAQCTTLEMICCDQFYIFMIRWYDLLLHNFDKHKIRDCKRVRWMHKNTVQRRYRAWSTSKEERQGMQGQLKNNNLESKRIFSRSQAIKVWLTKKWGWSCCCCWKSRGVQRKHKVTFSDRDIERKGGLYDNHDYIDYYLHRLTLFMMVDWCDDDDDGDDDGQDGCYGGSLGSCPSGKLLRGRNSPFSFSRFFSDFPLFPIFWGDFRDIFLQPIYIFLSWPGH